MFKNAIVNRKKKNCTAQLKSWAWIINICKDNTHMLELVYKPKNLHPKHAKVNMPAHDDLRMDTR